MKNLTTILILTFACTLTATAQGFIAETYVEKTQMSPKLGTSIGYQFPGNIQVGGFIQRSTAIETPEFGRPLLEENNFYGLFIAYPISTAVSWMDLHLKARTGVSNNQDFVITPSLHGTYTPFRILAVSAGVGMRSFQPAYTLSLKINLLGKKTES